jgi:hypothetical protein
MGKEGLLRNSLDGRLEARTTIWLVIPTLGCNLQLHLKENYVEPPFCFGCDCKSHPSINFLLNTEYTEREGMGKEGLLRNSLDGRLEARTTIWLEACTTIWLVICITILPRFLGAVVFF